MKKLADISLFESLCPNSQSNLAVFNKADEHGQPFEPWGWESGQAVYSVDASEGGKAKQEQTVEVIPMTDPEDGDICYGVEASGPYGFPVLCAYFWDKESARECADKIAERLKSGKSPWNDAWG